MLRGDTSVRPKEAIVLEGLQRGSLAPSAHPHTAILLPIHLDFKRMWGTEQKKNEEGKRGDKSGGLEGYQPLFLLISSATLFPFVLFKTRVQKEDYWLLLTCQHSKRSRAILEDTCGQIPALSPETSGLPFSC